MKDIVIEIDGVRHKLYNKDKVVCGCTVCSLRELCEPRKYCRGMCEPFLAFSQYGHFIEEDKM